MRENILAVLLVEVKLLGFSGVTGTRKRLEKTWKRKRSKD